MTYEEAAVRAAIRTGFHFQLLYHSQARRSTTANPVPSGCRHWSGESWEWQSRQTLGMATRYKNKHDTYKNKHDNRVPISYHDHVHSSDTSAHHFHTHVVWASIEH